MSKQIAMSKQCSNRLQKDVIDIIKNPLTEHGIYYAHDETNFLYGYAIVIGPKDTIYRPKFWNGYIVKPDLIEFWQDMPFRLHDRVEFKKTKKGWESRNLYP